MCCEGLSDGDEVVSEKSYSYAYAYRFTLSSLRVFALDNIFLTIATILSTPAQLEFLGEKNRLIGASQSVAKDPRVMNGWIDGKVDTKA